MNCSSIMCKKPIDDDSVFCKYCGAKQSRRVAPAPVAPKATPQEVAQAAADAADWGRGEPPEPPRFAAIPEQPPLVLPDPPTPETDFFLYAGTLKIYKGNSNIVVVPKGVTSIGAGVFKDHKNLKEVYLPEGLSTISSEAFSGCTGLEKINLPEGLTSIGPKAFFDCASLDNVIIPRSVNRILDNCFQNCTALKQIYLHDSVTTLSYHAFDGCSSLALVRMPKQMKVLPEAIFRKCTSLKGIELPAELKNIERAAFQQSGLEYIVIPLQTINIEEHAFGDIPTLRGITVPKIAKIDNYAFVNTNLINKGTIRYVM